MIQLGYVGGVRRGGWEVEEGTYFMSSPWRAVLTSAEVDIWDGDFVCVFICGCTLCIMQGWCE